MENTIALSALVGALEDATPFESDETSYNFTSTTAVPSFGISSVPLQPETAYVYAVVAHNTAGPSVPIGNFNATSGTIDEVSTIGDS